MEKINIKEELGKLIELQKLDSQIYALNQQKARHPVLLEELQNEFEEKKKTFKTLEETRQKTLLLQKTKEGDLAGKEEGIKKAQAQLGALKTNKDYQAKLAEIESLKADKSVIEEEILKLMDDCEEIKKRVEEEKKVLETEERKFSEKKKALEEKTKEIEASIADISGKRKILAASVEKQVLRSYEHILQGRGGLALVQVKTNSCEGCHMRVPHQVINEIKMHDRLITCENCSRILYLEEDFIA